MNDVLKFVAPTKRRSMTRARSAKVFLSRNGICVNCGVQIRQGERWFIEHKEPLALGGSDDDENLWPSHQRCKASKDAKDAGEKAKRDRIVTQGWTGGKRSSFPTNRNGKFKRKMNGEVVER